MKGRSEEPEKPRPLTPAEIQAADALMQAMGHLTEEDIRAALLGMRGEEAPSADLPSDTLTPGEAQAAGALLQAMGHLTRDEVRAALMDLRPEAPEPEPEPEQPAGWAQKVEARAFHYRAMDADGKVREGTLQASSEDRARKMLLGRYAALMDLSESTVPKERTQALRVRHETVVMFYRRFASMLAAGVTVSRALEFLRSSEPDKRMADVLEDLVNGVNGGRPLSAVISGPHLRAVFPTTCVGLVGLGEQTGALTEAMGKLAELTEAQLRQKRAMLAALTYPAVLFVTIILMALFFVFILGPGDGGLFAAFEGELPWPTRVMAGLAKVLRSPWIALATFGGVAVVGYWTFELIRFNRRVRLWVHESALHAPLVGDLIRKSITSRMLYVLSSALQVGVPATRALQMAAEVCTNDGLRRDFEAALREFRNGADLAQALERHEVFPRLVTAMIQTGQETGHLEEVLARVCHAYEDEVEMTLANLTRLAEPILLAFGGVVSGFLAVATMMPLIQLVNKL